MQSHAGRSALRAFVCRHCIARASLAARTTPSPLSRANVKCLKQLQISRRYSSSGHPDEESSHGDGRPSEEPVIDLLEHKVSASRIVPVRERLREFQDMAMSTTSYSILRDAARMGTENTMTRTEATSLAEIQSGESLLDGVNEPDQLRLWSQTVSGGGADADSDNVTSMLARPYGAVAPQAGDLIEVSTDSWRVQLLAVCLGKFRGMDHFYTSSGRWFVSSGVRSLFTVTRFASEEELAPLVAALPGEIVQAAEVDNSGAEISADTLDSLLNTLQELKLGPSREAGAALLRKMAEFSEQAAGIHMTHAGVLDNAFEVLRTHSATSPTRTMCMNLDEIASLLLRRQGHKKLGSRGQHNNHQLHYPLRNLRGAGSGAEGMDEFTAPAMYAVYRAIMSNDLAFRPLTTNLGNASETSDALSASSIAAGEKQFSHSRSCLFSISPPDDITVINDVSQVVRNFYEDAEGKAYSGQRASQKNLANSQLGAFIIKARRAIDRNRRTRNWSPYGMVGPFSPPKGEKNTKQPRLVVEKWSPSDIAIFQFIHLWASTQRFSASSRLHGVGSGILRALDRYGESEYLTMSTGWAFLQEVGWVSPWDLPARYSKAVPDTPPLRTGGVDRSLPDTAASLPSPSSSSMSDSLLSEDIFAGRRKEWGDLTAYCIDAANTTDIDDGIALERIPDNPDEFWVHIHVADPASRIRPGSILAEQAARMPLTTYLPGFYEPMFPNDIVYQEFSLGPSKPCLTFSARVNRQGVVLESKITPGRLGSVVFITPGEVSTVVADTEKKAMRNCNIADLVDSATLDMPWASASFSVGTPSSTDKSASSDAKRPMTAASELTPDQRADLETLTSLGTALRAVRLTNGAKPLFWPRPSVKVSLDNTCMNVVEVDTAEGNGPGHASTTLSAGGTTFLQCMGDPYIRIYYEGTTNKDNEAAIKSQAGNRLVESIMRLAGEVAANWCHDRGIAVPFRGQPDAIPHINRIQALTRNEVNPALAAGKRPPEAALRELNRYMGPDDVTAVAVPHIIMGVDRYTKATSPLRRYADMLVHWQVEGALLAEMDQEGKEGVDKSNNDSSTPAGPPFTREKMERDILPFLRVRERAVRKLDNEGGHDQWMLQAMVRAWLGDKTQDGTAQAGSSPKKPFADLHLTVTRISVHRGLISGRLNWFDRTALIDVTGLNEPGVGGDNNGMQRLTMHDVKPGQVYPVALSNVDVHDNLVIVRRTGDCIEESA
ncbi:3'-5' RNA exonuclease complex component [Sporothrix eucalyptigena]